MTGILSIQETKQSMASQFNDGRIKNYTVLYKDGSGVSSEFKVLARSAGHATIQAVELLPSDSEITRVFHDADWS